MSKLPKSPINIGNRNQVELFKNEETIVKKREKLRCCFCCCGCCYCIALFLLIVSIIGGTGYYFYNQVYPDPSLAIFPEEIK